MVPEAPLVLCRVNYCVISIGEEKTEDRLGDVPVIENEPKDLEEFIDLTKANKEAVIPPRCPFSKTSDKNENRGMKIARPTPSYLFERGHPISQINFLLARPNKRARDGVTHSFICPPTQ